jgi:hypothetical protein
MFKSTSHLIYDTKVFQILYSTYHKLNGGPCFFIFLLTQVFNLLSCVYIKQSIIFKLHFGRTIVFVYLTMFTPIPIKQKIKIKRQFMGGCMVGWTDLKVTQSNFLPPKCDSSYLYSLYIMELLNGTHFELINFNICVMKLIGMQNI